MDNDYTVTLALSALFGIALGYWLMSSLNTKYKRKMAVKRVKCFFGFHDADTIRDEGNFYVSRCFHCDKIVCRLENKNQTIRRVK